MLSHMYLTQKWLQDLMFSQWCYWCLKSYRTWHSVTGWVVPNVFKDQRAFIFKFKQCLQIPLPNSLDSFLMQCHVCYNTIRNLSALQQPCRITEHMNKHCLLCEVRDHLHQLCCQIKHLMLLYASLTTSEQMELQK